MEILSGEVNRSSVTSEALGFTGKEAGMIIMGHRGAAALEPENTLLSIERAIDIGVDAVEIDVRLTKEGELVVIHDSSVDRTTSGSGLVRDYELKALKKLDAGKGERIPTLQEVMELVGQRATLVVELKEAGTEEKVVSLIDKNSFKKNVYVISFWHRLVKAVREMDKDIRTGVLLVGCPVDTSVATRASAEALVMRYSFIDQDFVESAHKDNLKIFLWNIDDKRLLQPYIDMGVDGIASNDPRVLVEYFRQGR